MYLYKKAAVLAPGPAAPGGRARPRSAGAQWGFFRGPLI